jgi:predicted neutral ceramidase superfamily lipid hydrolase
MQQWAYEIQFIVALSFTLAIEILVLWSVLRLWMKQPKETLPLSVILTAGFFATAATLPFVWFIFPFVFRTYLPYIIISESFAVFAEMFLYMCCLRLKPLPALGVSLLCNSASFFGGEVLRLFI